MKEKRIDLSLFGEGEGDGVGADDSCAAEQKSSQSVTMPSEEPCREETEAQTGNTESPIAQSFVSQICEILGISDEGDEAVIRSLKSRIARADLSEKLRKRRAQREYNALMSEASALLSENRGFDLKKELSDRRFRAMISSGLSMSEAWNAIHTDEIIENAKTEAQRNALASAIESIRRQSERPEENGAGKNAPARSHTSVDNLSGRGIRDILRRVENGAKIKF